MLHFIFRMVLWTIAVTTFVVSKELAGGGLAGIAVGTLAAIGALSLIIVGIEKAADAVEARR